MIDLLREWAANYVATVFTSRNVITLHGYSADEEVANTLRGFINWLERTGATPWPAMCCPDCGGTGDLGTAPDGRQIACETCGGHEDSLGRGFLLPKESE